MICTKCGREIADNSRFCTFCGENVEPKPASEPEVPREPEIPKEPESPVIPETPTSATATEAPMTTPMTPQTPATPNSAPQSFPPPNVMPTDIPQGFSPSNVAPVGVPQNQDTPQGFPPPGAPQAAPQGFPPPGIPQGAPQTMPQGAPQNMYQGAPVYSETPPAPKKKKTGIIIAIVVVVLLLCGGVTFGGFLIYQGIVSSVDSSVLADMERHNINDNGDSSSSSNSDRGINRAVGDNVLLDSDSLTITLDLNNSELDEELGWYRVGCTIENKTDQELSLYFDYDTRIDGVDNDELFIVLYADNDDTVFVPNATTEGMLVIFTLPSNGAITNLEGTLVVFEIDTFETVGEYPVSMAKL